MEWIPAAMHLTDWPDSLSSLWKQINGNLTDITFQKCWLLFHFQFYFYIFLSKVLQQLKLREGHHFPYVKVVSIIRNWSLSWWSKYNLIVCIKDRWTFCISSIGIKYPARAHKMKIIVFIFDAIYVFLVKNEMVFVNFCREG